MKSTGYLSSNDVQWLVKTFWLPNGKTVKVSAAYIERNVCFWSCLHALIAHWGLVTHICVSKLTPIVSNNGLALSEPKLEYCHLELRNKLQWNLKRNSCISFKKSHLSSAKRRQFCLGLIKSLYLLDPLAHFNAIRVIKLVFFCCLMEMFVNGSVLLAEMS